MSSHETLPHSGLGLHKPGKESKPSHNVRKIVIGGIASTLIAGGTYFGVDRLLNSGSNINPDPIITDPIILAERCKAIEMAEEAGVVHIFDTECKKELTPEQNKQVEIQRVLALMPTFEGFQKVIKEVDSVEKYVYVAQKGNRYGVEVGAIGGFYKEEVTFEGEKVGGIAFVPKIVEKLLADKDSKAIFIPADISEIVDTESVDLSFLSPTMNDGKEHKNLVLQVDTNGNEVSISNPIAKSEWCTQGFLIPGLLPKDYFNSTFSLGHNAYDIEIMGNFIFDKIFQGYTPLGDFVVKTDKVFGITLNWGEGYHIINESEILKIGNSIVFLKDLN